MAKKKTRVAVITPSRIAQRIYVLRGQKVMFDSDLAVLYGVLTKNLNKAVQRNKERFPENFMFQLTSQEVTNLRFQIGTSSYGGRRYLPYVFTEHGVAMLSSVLHSKKAVQINIMIIRAFVQLRELLASNKELAARMEKLEAGHKRHGSILQLLVEEIKALKTPPPLPKKRQIGYIIKE